MAGSFSVLALAVFYEDMRMRVIDQPYLCIDGEGIGDSYILLTASNGQSIYNAGGLRTNEIMDFLFAQNITQFWTFAGTYDINNWLRGLSQAHIDRLNSSPLNTVRWGVYVFQHYYGKYFRASKMVDGKRHVIHVWDFYHFVQSSFVEWLTAWRLCDHATLERIRADKSLRGQFNAEMIDEIRAYNLLEVQLMQAGIEKFYDMLKSSDIVPKVFYSPASLAATAFEMHNTQLFTKHAPYDDELSQAITEAYYGGRFEASHVGRVNGPLHHYDIRSAYPAQMSRLPALGGGHFEPTGSCIDLHDNSIRLVRVTWKEKHPRVHTLYAPLPVRIDAGSIRYPLRCDEPRWYWQREAAAASALTDVRVHASYTFVPLLTDRPFAYLEQMYLKKSDPANVADGSSKIYKLILNASYGKLSQRQMENKPPSRWRELVYAGLITAGTRAMLLNAIAQAPIDILFLATDGLVSKTKLDLEIGTGMGQWEYDMLEWIFIVQSGLYFWSADGVIQQHSRGIGRGQLDYESVAAAFKHNESLETSSPKFVGYKTALREDWAEWCTWRQQDKVIKWTMSPRRRDGRRSADGAYLLTYPPLRAMSDPADVALAALAGSAFENDDTLESEQPDIAEGTVL